MKAATIDRTQLPPETQLKDEERADFKIQVANEDAFPLPTFQWYLDNEPVTLEPRSSYLNSKIGVLTKSFET